MEQVGFYNPTEKDKKLYSKMSVCVLTPVMGYLVSAKFSKCLANMIAYSWMNGLKVYSVGITERTAVQWARNNLAEASLDKLNEYTGDKFTHLLWFDDDQTFNPDIAVRLASHDKEMVSALYFGRTSPHFPVVYVKNEKSDYGHYPITGVPCDLFQCDAVGFGGLLMRRDVFERVPRPWFTLDSNSGEDIAFCVAARKHGVRIWCDGAYKMGHIGDPKIVLEKDWLASKEANPDRFKDDVKIDFSQEEKWRKVAS